MHSLKTMKSFKHKHLFIITIIFFSYIHLSSSSFKVPAIIVFGDSTVDTGNNNQIGTILKSNFEPYGRDFIGGEPTGRFCNGRLGTDFISEALGLGPLVPAYLDPSYDIKDFAKGVCFASAGTGLDRATSDVLSVIPLSQEVEYFKEYQKRLQTYIGKSKARFIVKEAIYVISIGTNDFLENYFLFITGRFMQFTPDEYEDYLISLAEEFLTQIYQLGARKIVFVGLAPMGCLPLERTTNVLQGHACIDKYSKVARSFNAKLEQLTHQLCANLRGIRVKYFPVYDSIVDIIKNPSKYGIENVRDGCCGTGKIEMGYLCDKWNPHTCPDASKYLFWDAFHPTERINQMVARNMLNSSLAEFL